jgi:Fic family protein
VTDFFVKLLPPENLEETKPVLKKLASAHRYLAELKGIAASIPNQSILINTLALQEAKDSSAIENIITTHDAMYKAQLFNDVVNDASAKEVSLYAEALKHGFDLAHRNQLLTINHVVEIQQLLEQNNAGIRKIPGTALVNPANNAVVYTPPQDYQTIMRLMENLMEYINHPAMHDVDPLVKMAVIHYQFESIHPFYDGNGRTGRILNLLYLVLEDLLTLPILYLSRYIIQHKGEYYRLLQNVREKDEWEPWLLYMLEAVGQTSQQTIELVNGIKTLMMDYKHRIRSQHPKIYSQDLINNLFRHPYTKIEFLMQDINISRYTSARYLDQLAEDGFLVKEKIGRSNFYINLPLFNLLKGESETIETEPRILTRQLNGEQK